MSVLEIRLDSVVDFSEVASLSEAGLFFRGGGGSGMLGGGGIMRLTGRLTRCTLGRSDVLGGGSGRFLGMFFGGASSVLALTITVSDSTGGALTGDDT